MTLCYNDHCLYITFSLRNFIQNVAAPWLCGLDLYPANLKFEYNHCFQRNESEQFFAHKWLRLVRSRSVTEGVRGAKCAEVVDRAVGRRPPGFYCRDVLGGCKGDRQVWKQPMIELVSPYHLCWDSDFKQRDLVYPVRVLPRSEYVVGNAYTCIVSFRWYTFSVACCAALTKLSYFMCGTLLNRVTLDRTICRGK